jgi:branched-chain amino acid transport system ATP-binding protein
MSQAEQLLDGHVLLARNLVKSFGGIEATRSVDLALPKGARHALIGPNGAGKTTLINLLTGVLQPTSGEIFLMGHEITGLPASKRVHRGLVRTFQINQLFDRLTPLQSLALAVAEQRKQGWRWHSLLGSQAAVMDRALELLEDFSLQQWAHIETRHLPYGKRRMLEIALALAAEPRVLLLDEPAAGVPAGERAELLASVEALPEDVAVLLIEHDMDLVFSFARKITVLVNGAVLTEGTPQAIANDPAVREVYLGTGAGHD